MRKMLQLTRITDRGLMGAKPLPLRNFFDFLGKNSHCLEITTFQKKNVHDSFRSFRKCIT